jgi:putative membrane protein
MEETADATRRTRLANDRTQLAWWRTGLTALAVALAIGRVVPVLGETSYDWAYTVIGAGFALYGLALIFYGSARSQDVNEALSRGDDLPPQGRMVRLLMTSGVVLALATAVLIVVD